MPLTLAALQTLPAELLARRDAQEIADAYNADPANAEVVEYWLTDRGLVADLVVKSGGDTALSDGILNKLDAAMVASRSAKAQINRLYNDPKGLNFGDAALRGWFAASTPAVFTADECAALLSLPVRAVVVTAAEVEIAAKTDDGQWLI